MNRYTLAAGASLLLVAFGAAQIRVKPATDLNSLQEQINALKVKVDEQAGQIKTLTAENAEQGELIKSVDFNLRHHGHSGLLPFPPIGAGTEATVKKFMDAAVQARPALIAPNYMSPLWTVP